MKTKRLLTIAAVGLIGAAGFTMAAIKAAPTMADDKTPELSGACVTLEVEEGNKLAFRAFAIGVQIYQWNGAAWVLVAPDAKLFANPNYEGQIATHFAGPTWKSNSGSNVVAAKVDECTPDSTAIAWLKLQTVTSDGPGIFARVSFVQRLNTRGGLKPTLPGSFVGEERRVPYTAEYIFYRPANPADPN